jgi:DNA invertase Pin-like site-specific DNA recombinase
LAVGGVKGSLNEYELDLLRQRSLAARYEKARRVELVVSAPVGFVKAGDRYEKDPDRRVQEAIRLVLNKVWQLRNMDFAKVTEPRSANPVCPWLQDGG